jgi:hypothetical protein
VENAGSLLRRLKSLWRWGMIAGWWLEGGLGCDCWLVAGPAGWGGVGWGISLDISSEIDELFSYCIQLQL